jgi:hypothetical protein
MTLESKIDWYNDFFDKINDLFPAEVDKVLNKMNGLYPDEVYEILNKMDD